MHWIYNEFVCALSTIVQQLCNNRPADGDLVKQQVRNAVSNPHAVKPGAHTQLDLRRLAPGRLSVMSNAVNIVV